MNIKRLIPGLILLLAGCNGFQYVSYENDTNYLTFNHPFTDKDIAQAQSGAEKLCRQRKQVAIKTSEKCSLTKCTTNFQCLDQADASKYGL
jgi:hypothetical protein